MRAAVRRAVRVGAMLVPLGLGLCRTARAEDTEPISRLEVFAGVGVTATIAHQYASPTEGWPTFQLGAGYRMGRTVSLGGLVGLDLVGEQNLYYFPPGSDFQSAHVRATMVPVCAYVEARLPRYQRARWFVAAHGGAYLCQTHADSPYAPDLGGTLPAFGASLGLSGDEQRLAPRIEFGYEARYSSAGEWFPEGWLQSVALRIGLRGQR